MEQPKQELGTLRAEPYPRGVPLEQQTTTHRKDGRVTPCVSYGTVADYFWKVNDRLNTRGACMGYPRVMEIWA